MAQQMMATNRAAVMLVQPELALDAYLQALLATVPDDEDFAPPVDVEESLARVAEITEPVAPEVEVDVAVVVQEAEPAPQKTSPIIDGDFHALFFRLGDITIATPVLDLRRIIDFDDVTLTLLPKQPSWLLGLVDNQGEKIGVMHTAELILGREKAQRRDFDAQPYSKMIISRHGRYGFACDEVLEMVKLKAEDICWRETPQGRRPWLLGTIKERLSVLVDLAELSPIRR